MTNNKTAEELAEKIHKRFEAIIYPISSDDESNRVRKAKIAEILEQALLAAEQRGAQQAQGWRDISTAPKDAFVFIWIMEQYKKAHVDLVMGMHKDGVWHWRKGDRLVPLLNWEPIYWMPLPPAPNTPDMGIPISDYQRGYADGAASEDGNYQGCMADLDDLLRVALTNKDGLDEYIKKNYPKEYERYMKGQENG